MQGRIVAVWPNVETASMDTTRHLTVASDMDQIERVHQYTESLREWTQLDKEKHSDALLALNEAVTNAIVHGNRQDSSKQVYITFTLEKSALVIEVQDEGQGFDPEELPDPVQEENLLNPGGRGVFLIRQYTDRCYFSENGTKITMVFDR